MDAARVTQIRSWRDCGPDEKDGVRVGAVTTKARKREGRTKNAFVVPAEFLTCVSL